MAITRPTGSIRPRATIIFADLRHHSGRCRLLAQEGEAKAAGDRHHNDKRQDQAGGDAAQILYRHD
jgi:hypothetical protein